MAKKLLSEQDIEQSIKNDVYIRKKIFLDFCLYTSILVIACIVIFILYSLFISQDLRNLLATKIIEAIGYVIIIALGLIGFNLDRFKR